MRRRSGAVTVSRPPGTNIRRAHRGITRRELARRWCSLDLDACFETWSKVIAARARARQRRRAVSPAPAHRELARRPRPAARRGADSRRAVDLHLASTQQRGAAGAARRSARMLRELAASKACPRIVGTRSDALREANYERVISAPAWAGRSSSGRALRRRAAFAPSPRQPSRAAPRLTHRCDRRPRGCDIRGHFDRSPCWGRVGAGQRRATVIFPHRTARVMCPPHQAA